MSMAPHSHHPASALSDPPPRRPHLTRTWTRRLISAGVAALAFGLATPRAEAADLPESAPSDTSAPAPSTAKASLANELLVSMGSTALLSPAIYSTARLIGTSTGNLNTSALPALLFAAIVPPAVASGALLWERRREGAHARFITPYLYALGAQVLVMTASVFMQTFVGDPRDLLLLSAATGVACGGAATLGAELKF